MTVGHVIRSSAYYQNQYNEGVRDELISDMDGAYGSDPGILTDYTAIDEMLDKQDAKPKNPEQKSVELPDDIFSPVHDYGWACGKAFEGEHCICNPYPQYRLVYAQDKWTLRRYDKNGITIETIDPTYEAMNCRSWRVWDYRK